MLAFSLFTYRTAPPCKDCSVRCVGCHSTCEKYIEWRNNEKKKNDEIKFKQNMERIKEDYAIHNQRKRKRKRRRDNG